MEHEKFVREGPVKGFAEPRLLCLISKSPSYGYQLADRIGELPFPGPGPDAAAVYRKLREMEKHCLVVSHWEHGEAGPSKRVYKITVEGEKRLEAWKDALAERVAMLNRFISMCEKGA
ncbi:MAG: PadR family transcriptional regulator [Actinomycetota bacterium]